MAWWSHMTPWIWANIGSGYGLLPDGNKPLPEPMLTQRLLPSIPVQFHSKMHKIYWQELTYLYQIFKDFYAFSGGRVKVWILAETCERFSSDLSVCMRFLFLGRTVMINSFPTGVRLTNIVCLGLELGWIIISHKYLMLAVTIARPSAGIVLYFWNLLFHMYAKK